MRSCTLFRVSSLHGCRPSWSPSRASSSPLSMMTLPALTSSSLMAPPMSSARALWPAAAASCLASWPSGVFRMTSAWPCFRRAWHTPLCPLAAAACSAVQPWHVPPEALSSTAALLPRSSSTLSRAPALAATSSSGSPAPFLSFASTPQSSAAWMQGLLPCEAAAMWMAVSPLGPWMPAFAPDLSSTLTAAALPQSTADIRGVRPAVFFALRSTPGELISASKQFVPSLGSRRAAWWSTLPPSLAFPLTADPGLSRSSLRTAASSPASMSA
mmetsp:Transcript_61469/g.159622  ORF Transcript_61469/g.159622 Transcript_61469/m.159622 type:complete len:271 (+) Transcript_61469:707-1519(+)